MRINGSRIRRFSICFGVRVSARRLQKPRATANAGVAATIERAPRLRPRCRRRRCRGSPRAEAFSPSTVINDARQRWLFRMVHTPAAAAGEDGAVLAQPFRDGLQQGRRPRRRSRGDADDGGEAVGASRRDCAGQLELFRDYALAKLPRPAFRGRQRSGHARVARWPANTKARPQENFAREIMELFTIGVGQFTEADVYAGARVFTGWNLQRIGDGRRSATASTSSSTTPAQHDTNAKTFSFPIYRDGSRTIPARAAARGHAGRHRSDCRACAPSGNGAASGAQAVVVFRQRNSAAADDSFVDQIAHVYLQSDCHMAPVVRAVLSVEGVRRAGELFRALFVAGRVCRACAEGSRLSPGIR